MSESAPAPAPSPVTLKRLRAFTMLASLNDDELEQWLPRFQQELRPRNELIYREGEPPNRFYLVESGQIAAYKRGDSGGDEFLGYYGPGEGFGERELVTNDVRQESTRIAAQANLLYLSNEDFLALVEAFPKVWLELSAFSNRREQYQMARFHGRRPDEAVIVFSHRHWIRLIAPWTLASFLLVAVMLLGAAFITIIPGVVLAAAFVIYFISLAYYYFDYRDDWFIVTSKRVIRRQASFEFFNESQDEAPIESVQNVTTRMSSFLENLLNYGDVIIQTAGGKVAFDSVPHPALTRDAILAEVQRIREHRRMDELSEIRKALRSRFDTGPDLPPPPKPPPPPALRTGFSKRARQMFGTIQILPPTRLVKDNQIIWREHWLVLYKQTIVPVIGLLVLIPLSLYMVFGDFMGVRVPLALALILAAVGGPVLLVWLFYGYRDWENDIYVLTPDQLIDSERKPFWLEEKVKVLGLGQIQNVRFERSNLLQNILNFGTVVVQTAGQDTGLVFLNIPNPREVEERILEALEKYKQRQSDRDRQQRRREFLDWFGEYHRLLNEKEKPSSQP